MAVNFKLVLESPTNSTYSRARVVFQSDVSNLRSITKEKQEKYKGTVCSHDSFLCLVKLQELTFKHKKM